MTNAVIGILPSRLAALFPSPPDIRRLITDAGLDPGLFLVPNIPPAIAWTWILGLIENSSAFAAVIRAAQVDFPTDPILATALQDSVAGLARKPPKGSEVQMRVLGADLAIAADSMRFRYIPPATVGIGSDGGYRHEQPRHLVSSSAFFMQETPVTYGQFAAFVESTGYRTSPELGADALCLVDGVWAPRVGATWRQPVGDESLAVECDEHPVVQVTWYDAMIFCSWLAGETGLEVGLPSEVQWEYSGCGTDGRRWPFGDLFESRMANMEGLGTTPVRQFGPNGFGLHDMAGNVYEWCADWYADSWTRAGHALSDTPVLDPAGPGAGTSKVLRGGSWFDSPYHCRCANRYYAAPVLASANWGFRCRVRLTESLVKTLASDAYWSLRPLDMLRGVG